MAKNEKKKKKTEEENIEEQEKETAEKEEMVTIPLKSMEEQLREIDELKDKVNENLDGWQRERADFDNYRKRIMRDREQEKQNITIDVIKKYLSVHDDLYLAMKNAPESDECKQWIEGLNLISQKMMTILDTEGIEQIDPHNDLFDPQFHEAISLEENPDLESGQIIEVIKRGYKINNRVIRPAMVRVAK